MNVSATNLDDIIMDARWLAHRFRFTEDRYEFAFMPREAHRQTAFLDTRLPTQFRRIAVPRQAAACATKPRAPLHFIFHSGMAGSTLMARALDCDGTVMSLKEPAIMSDVVRYSLSGADAEKSRRALDEVLSLLARPFGPGEALVVKSESLSLRFAETMLEIREDSQAVCLYAPLPVFLTSLVRKGIWGRLWGRKLFLGLRNARMVDLGFSDPDYFAKSDLQIAACAWLTFHQHFARLVDRFGPQRVRTVDSETFIRAPEETLLALSDHFRLGLAAGQVQAIVAGPVFSRDAKTGEPYDPSRRARRTPDSDGPDADEITSVAGWAPKVCEAQRFPFDLGCTLTDNSMHLAPSRFRRR
jgi:hypothetical protein